METAAKKIKIVKPGDNFSFRVPVPDLDRAEINAHSLHAITVKEYSNGQAGDKVHFNSSLEQSINRFRCESRLSVQRGHAIRNLSQGASFPTRRAIF